MKNLFVGLLIFGAVAGIVAAFFGLAERIRFNRMAHEANTRRDEAVVEQREAEKARQHAEKIQYDAESKKNVAEQERDQALDKAKKSNERADEADRLKEEAEQAKEVAETDSKKAIEERKTALEERDKGADERDQALANLDVEKDARITAERKRDEAIAYRSKADRELADWKELSELAKKTIAFVGSFNNILFPCLDDGDGYFIQGLDLFGKAKTRQDKYKAVGFINKASDKYIEARDKLKTLAFIDDRTREIVEISQESTVENIKSIGIIRDVLKDKIGNKSLSVPVIREKADEAAKRKEKADRLMIEVCEKLLGVIDTYKEGFTKAQRSHIQELKKKVEVRLGIPSAESTLPGISK